MRALLPACIPLLVVAACGGSQGDDAQSLGEDVTATAAAINIGFNGGPDQFDYFADFYGASTLHGEPRLCHTYLVWNVADQAASVGDAQSPGGSRAWFEYWLQKAQGHCDEALVSFQAHAKGAPPSAGAFAKAFDAFLAQPWATETGFTGRLAFTPWNEPDNPASSGNGLGQVIAPELAAEYYLAAEKACRAHGCKVAAGDFASNGSFWNDFEWNCADDNVAPHELCKTASSLNTQHRAASYLDRYKDTIANQATAYGLPKGFRPPYFAFHGWHDANEYLNAGNHCGSYDDCATRRLLQSLGGSWGGVEIWDTEVGVDQDAAPVSDAEQACGAAFLLRLTALSPRVRRLYYTRLHGGTGELLAGHTPRAALEVLAGRRTSYPAGHCR